MRAQTIVEKACAMGIILDVKGDKIRYSPKSRTPHDFVEMLQRNKEELIVYLSRQQAEVVSSNNEGLISWAAELAEQCLDLPVPVQYIEAPLRVVSTIRASYYASVYLRTISAARSQQRTGGWYLWTPEWWHEREEEALGALRSLRETMQSQKKGDDQ